MTEERRKNPEGWPDTDPYPFRDLKSLHKEPPDCPFVAADKEYAKEVKVEELGDYAYIMRVAWQNLNELYKKNQQLEDHIKWLNNVGGERLNTACGIDILCRDMVIEKRKKQAEEKPNSST